MMWRAVSFSSGFNSNKLDAAEFEKWEKESDGITAAANTGKQDLRNDTAMPCPSPSWLLKVRKEKGDLCFFGCWNLEMTRK